jgi:Spy/CpxP family protein refolding chaperone
MGKKMIIGLVASLLFTSGLLASGEKCCDSKESKSCKEYKMHMGKKHMGKKHGFVKKVMRLELSDKQKKEIKDIVAKCKNNMPKPYEAFTDTEFDKAKFIKLAKAKKDSKIERKAKMMEKVYAVLNSSQKKELKSILDRKGLMMKPKSCKSGKCNK